MGSVPAEDHLKRGKSDQADSEVLDSRVARGRYRNRPLPAADAVTLSSLWTCYGRGYCDRYDVVGRRETSPTPLPSPGRKPTTLLS